MWKVDEALKKPETELTVEGVDPSGHPLYDRIFYFSPSHALDAQILEAATDRNTTHTVTAGRQGCCGAR